MQQKSEPLYGCWPVTTADGGFSSGLSDKSVALPVAGYNYNGIPDSPCIDRTFTRWNGS